MLKRLFHTGYSRIIGILFVLLVTAGSLSGQSRKVMDFNGGWWFKLDSNQQYSNGRKGEGWRKLDLPHDWSIEMPFRENSPAGSGAAYLDGGIGWYQKSFKMTRTKRNQRIFIAFEGVYENSEVWINGHFLGKRPNGYIGFEYEMSRYLYWDGRENLLSVKVNNKNQPNSRFYSGSGIYRDVKLICRNPTSIGTNSVFIKAGSLNEKRAIVDLSLTVEHSRKDSKNMTLLTEVLSAQGVIVARKRTTMATAKADVQPIAQQIVLENPVLWDIESPYQYTAKMQLMVDGQVVDEQHTKFGLRHFKFDQQQGFILNGRQLKIRGVCLHSDLGALGMAFNRSAALRQLRMMKTMGVNGIRTSHNPAAPAFLDLC
uniref:glycoside hydrolase family 2 protein n=1 Tax=Sphingobacterium sp. TaxID=341027 RepID=UPI00289A1CA9